MRINKLHTICTMTLAMILFVGFEASASNWEMEAGAGCMDEACMFGGQTVAQNSGVAQLHKINLFAMNGVDPRVQTDRAQEAVRPYLPAGFAVTDAPILGLDGTTGVKESNAFLVSPCYALVDYHGVYGKQKNPNQEYSMTIHLGVGELENGFKWALKMTPVPMNVKQENGRNGLVLMQLEKCAGKKLGWMNLTIPGAKSLVGQSVDMVAYHGDLSKAKLAMQKNCKIQGYNSMSGMLTHDCGARAGSTGGMLVKRDANGSPVVVATNWGAGVEREGVLKEFSREQANIAVPLDMIKENPEMMQIISDDIKAFGQENPATVKAKPVQTRLASAAI